MTGTEFGDALTAAQTQVLAYIPPLLTAVGAIAAAFLAVPWLRKGIRLLK